MGEDRPDTEPAPEGQMTPPRRRNVTILLGFLLVFVVLLIAFRQVLFPFLMAIFIAYLIEPVVASVTKSRVFGVKWTRGPTIVLIYVVVLGGVSFGVWKGLVALASFVRDTSQDILDSAKLSAPKAVFVVPSETRLKGGVVVPSGTEVRSEDGRRFETEYRIRIERESRRVSSILIPVDPKADDALNLHEELTLVAPDALVKANPEGLPDPFELTIMADIPATGLEARLERELVSPIVENLEKRGIVIEPTSVREFASHKANVLSAELPDRLGKGALAFAGKIALSVYEFFLILMLTAFIVMDRRTIAGFFASLPPPKFKDGYLKLLSYVDEGLAGVIRGQLVICVVNGVLTYIGLLLIGVKAALMLSSVAAVLSLIPIFGTIVSSIPIVLVASTDGLDKGVFALLWIVFIHMLEANVLNPLIMGSNAKMHPVVIIFALLAGEYAFGVWGALLAVPTMSIIQACFRFYLYEIEGHPKPPPDERGAWAGKAWRWIRGRFSKGAQEEAA